MADEESAGRVRLLRFYRRRSDACLSCTVFLSRRSCCSYIFSIVPVHSLCDLAGVDLLREQPDTQRLGNGSLVESCARRAVLRFLARVICDDAQALADEGGFGARSAVHDVANTCTPLFARRTLYPSPILRMDTFLIGGAFAIADRTFISGRSAPFFIGALAVWSIVGPGCFRRLIPVCLPQ